MEDKLVVPGELLGTEEEFISGSGTYEESGNVYSSTLGKVEVGSDFKVRVRGEGEKVSIQVGDVIVGVVSEINEPLIIVSGEYLIKSGKVYRIGVRALVHASRVTGHYLDQCSKAVKVRDVVRGKVVSMRGKVDLSLEAPENGVTYAFCSRCRKPLERINSGLYCTYCQRQEVRKISVKYRDFSEVGVK